MIKWIFSETCTHHPCILFQRHRHQCLGYSHLDSLYSFCLLGHCNPNSWDHIWKTMARVCLLASPNIRLRGDLFCIAKDLFVLSRGTIILLLLIMIINNWLPLQLSPVFFNQKNSIPEFLLQSCIILVNWNYA